MRNNCSNYWDYTMSLWHAFQSALKKSSHLRYIVHHDPSHGTYCVCIYNKRTCKAKVTRTRRMNEQQAIGLAWAAYCGIQIPEMSNPVPISSLKRMQQVNVDGTKAIYYGMCCNSPMFYDKEAEKAVKTKSQYVRVYY